MSHPFSSTTPLPISQLPSCTGSSTTTTTDSDTTTSPFTPLDVTYDPASTSEQHIQQPLQQELASFVAERADYSLYGASIMGVNSNFIVYAVKNGLIRILSRHSATKSLLRLHQNEIVSDIQFFHDGEFLATVSATKSDVTPEDGVCRICSSRVIVWRVYQRNNGLGGADDIIIATDPMLEIRSTTRKMVRVIWHPFNPNQFFIMHSSSSGTSTSSGTSSLMMATLIETTKIATTADPIQNHAVADFTTFSSLQPNGSMVAFKDAVSLHDLAWSGVDVNCVMGGYDGGELIFYDLSTSYQLPSILDALQSNSSKSGILHRIHHGSDSINRCLFLPHYDSNHSNSVVAALPSATTTTTTKHNYTSCFVTGGGGGGGVNSNATITLWSAFTSESQPMVIQTIHIAAPAANQHSYILNTCYGPSSPSTTTPPSCFIIACCRELGRVYAFHVKAQWSKDDDEQSKRVLLSGSDYVVPFTTKHPILSCTITCAPTANTIEEDDSVDDGIRSINFDMKLFVYQTVAAQCLQLTSHMCLPPRKPYSDATPGVTAKHIANSSAVTNVVLESALITNDSKVDDGFEDYDIDETEEDEYDAAPDPSSLPNPSSSIMSGNSTTNSGSNPFSNWLGALAATSTPPAAIVSKPIAAPIPIPTATIQKSVPQMNVTAPLPSTKQTNPRPQTQKDVPATLLSPMEILGLVPVKSNVPSTNDINSAKDYTKVAPRPPVTNTKDKHQTRAVAPETHPTMIPDGENTASAPNGRNGLSDEQLETVIRAIIQKDLVPSIRQEMVGMVQPLTDLIKPLQSSIDEVSKNQKNENGTASTNEAERITAAVTTNIEEGMKRMFTDCTRTILIPTIESVTSQIFTKVSEHLDAKSSNENKKLELIARQLATASTLITELTKEVHVLREELRKTSSSTETINEPIAEAETQLPVIDPYDQQRSEILSCIKVRNYESAFRRAVSNKTVDMALFCCHSVEMYDVFGESPPAVSQPILLCLMQQLGTVLDTSPDVQFIIDWLQEITVALYPPVDPQINPHLPAVVQNLVTNLMKRMSRTNDDPALRRSLQKLQSLLRGMNLKA